MWTSEFSMVTNVPASRIWQAWSDVENWREWDESVEFSSLNGSFEDGAVGVLKSVGGPQSAFRLKDVVANKSFTSQTKLPFCTMDFVHEIVEDSGVVRIKHCIEMRGVFTFIFKNIIGKNAAKSLPDAVKKLVDLCAK